MEESRESEPDESIENGSHEGKSLEERIDYSLEQKEEKDSKRTINGAIGLLYHYDSESKILEVIWEQKPSSYAIKSETGKLQPPGGAIDTTDESSLYALAREFREEIEDERAKRIAIKALKSQTQIPYVLPSIVDGQPAKTYLYLVEIESKDDWKALKSSDFTDDAGPKRVFRHYEIGGLPDNYFAWGFGPELKGIIGKIVDSKIPNSSIYLH